jgi:hypothetical protein
VGIKGGAGREDGMVVEWEEEEGGGKGGGRGRGCEYDWRKVFKEAIWERREMRRERNVG